MSTSVVIKARDFGRAIDQGLAPEQFKYRFLAEGDSWMERSAVFQASLPEYLGRLMADANEPVLIINLAMFGDQMRRIGDTVGGEFTRWINDWTYDAVLLSAGGNDFIDAARDPAPGHGLLHDLRGQPAPADPRDCIVWPALRLLVDQYLDPNFDLFYGAVRASAGNREVPILLNGYDTPFARNAPAIRGRKAWLHEAYTKNGIPAELWVGLTALIFDELERAVRGWARDRSTVALVPTRGTLTPATATTSGDWVNEIHPNGEGWEKLAKVWRTALGAVLP